MARRVAGPPSRGTLSRSLVLDRALELADREGLDALSIRRLGQELGVTPMALYWHFEGKEDMMSALGDRVIQEVDLSVDPSCPWLEQVRTLITLFLAALRRHPSACPLLAGRTQETEGSLVALEVVLDVLRRAGFSPDEATQLSRHSLRSLFSLVAAEPRGAPSLGPEEREAAQRRARLLLESLPPDRFPRVIEAARPLSGCDDPDGYYRFGVDLLLAGVEAMWHRRAP